MGRILLMEKIGFTYNQKRIVPGGEPGSDREAEFDPPSTLEAVRTALRELGYEVVDLEATPELPAKLLEAKVDMVFNIAEGIRGRYRESQVPALLELLNIEHTGSDAAALGVTLDKGLAKRVVSAEGVATPQFFPMMTGREKLPAGFPFPAIAKPIAEGSSKGVTPKSVVGSEAELREAVRRQLEQYRQPILVETYLPGREFTVALLGHRRPRILPPMEILFGESAGHLPVYAFEHKQAAGDYIRYAAPADIDAGLKRKLELASGRAFKALGCRDVARMDFRLDAVGVPNFIECNPLPGLTPGWSDLCMIAESAGLGYTALIAEILAPGLRRLKERRRVRAEVSDVV
jgi:D-alanine-D-alanine ligase